MTMIEDKKYELIAAHLAGETDKEENERLSEWIGKSAENKRVFEELSAMWTYGLTDDNQMEKSKEVVLGRVLSSVRRRRLLRPVAAVASIAAAVSLGFVAAAIFLRPERIVETMVSEPEGEITLSTLPGQKAEATLADGTRIWLNSGTTITYPAAYGIGERTTTLVEGEVFMEVAKNVDMPFVLNTSEGFVKVYGTSFNVRNYPTDQSMTISLKEGSIEYFSSDNQSKVLMVPGQKVVLDKKVESPAGELKDSVVQLSSAMVLQKCDAEVESVWRFGELKIERKSFSDLMTEMERWYGVEIKVSGNIPADSYYWMTIKTESLREMLALLAKITPLTYKIDGKDVAINVK